MDRLFYIHCLTQDPLVMRYIIINANDVKVSLMGYGPQLNPDLVEWGIHDMHLHLPLIHTT